MSEERRPAILQYGRRRLPYASRAVRFTPINTARGLARDIRTTHISDASPRASARRECAIRTCSRIRSDIGWRRYLPDCDTSQYIGGAILPRSGNAIQRATRTSVSRNERDQSNSWGECDAAAAAAERGESAYVDQYGRDCSWWSSWTFSKAVFWRIREASPAVLCLLQG